MNRSSTRARAARTRRSPLARLVAALAVTAVAGTGLAVSGVTAAPAEAASVAAGSVTLWGDAAPKGAVDSDRAAVQLGTQFRPTTSGSVVGVRFYKTAENTGTHTGSLWDASGKRLAAVTFANETTRGWQTAYFDKPVTVTANQRYVAAYHAPKGRYFATGQFTGDSQTPLLAVERGNTGVYAYGSASTAPTKTWNRSQYWVDPVFSPAAAAKPTAAPTAAPTQAPAPTPTSAPPSGTGFPNASNTGVRAGTTLTPYTGPSRITKPGTVIENALITTPLVIAAGANDVTIRNSVIRARGFWLVLNDEGATNLQIVDTELDGLGNTASDSAVGGRNYTLTRVDIHGTIDGLKIGSNVTVQDSFIHDLVMTADSHNDGIQSLGSDNVKIQRNTILVADGATSAIILSTGSATSMRNILIDGNLLGGGAYTVYGGYQSGVDVLSRVSGITISNNRISTSVFPRGGAFGPFSSVDAPAVTLSNNVWHEGSKAGQKI